MMTGQAKLAQRRHHMFTITNTIRTIIALSAGVVAIAFSGVASAAMPVHLLAAPVATTVRVIAPPVATPHKLGEFLNPHKVGEGGLNGGTTEGCEQRAKSYNHRVEGAEDAAEAGDQETEVTEWARAEEDLKVIEDNCLIID
jgi:hypothetical protein